MPYTDYQRELERTLPRTGFTADFPLLADVDVRVSLSLSLSLLSLSPLTSRSSCSREACWWLARLELCARAANRIFLGCRYVESRRCCILSSLCRGASERCAWRVDCDGARQHSGHFVASRARIWGVHAPVECFVQEVRSSDAPVELSLTKGSCQKGSLQLAASSSLRPGKSTAPSRRSTAPRD